LLPIGSVLIDLSLESALMLAIIVLVRTLLSFSLEVELEGALPWRLAGLRRSNRPAGEGPSQLAD
jgi:hypothetical protein